ncbi:MAG: hypothetical protein KKH91_07885 [Elusimicrobia bacterium]|nr:hypothetical protein [Elusimicrobiota bacterium]
MNIVLTGFMGSCCDEQEQQTMNGWLSRAKTHRLDMKPTDAIILGNK